LSNFSNALKLALICVVFCAACNLSDRVPLTPTISAAPTSLPLNNVNTTPQTTQEVDTALTPAGIPPASGSNPGGSVMTDYRVVGSADVVVSGIAPCLVTPNSSDPVNVRTGPGGDFPVIALLNPGLYLVPFEYNNGWYGTNISPTEVGYVSETVVTVEGNCSANANPAAQLQASQVCSIRPLISVLNIYGGPGPEFPVVGALGSEYQMQVFGRADNGWISVATYDGVSTGWVNPNEVALVGPC
jgi:uncharacterized protein YraI